jgi:predicted ArsR family transcriptional regulator
MDELNAVGDPALRSALLFARSHAAAITVDDLAEAEAVHRNVARSRLDRLADAGLLAVGYERRSGRTGPGAGRPARVYGVTPALTAIEFPDRRLELLVGHLVDALPGRGKRSRLREAGIAFGADFARAAGLEPAETHGAAAEKVCASVRRLGYQAAVEQATEQTAVLVTPTCPLRPLVNLRPDAADIDRGFWAGLAATASGVPIGRVTCTTCDCHEQRSSCRVVISVGGDG